MWRYSVVLIGCLMVCGLARGSEESLAKAKADFAEADRLLNEAYQQTRKALDESQFDKLRQEQRAWLTYRDGRSVTAVHYEDRAVSEGEEKSSPAFWNMMAHLTRQRTEMVRAWRDTRRDKPLTGRYADDYGGRMLLLQQDDKLYFVIDVVRGPTYHMGHLSGIAQINGSLARFSDNDVHEHKKETWVTFITGEQRLHLITANSQYYCGARAYFDGKYLRVSDLTDEERKAVFEQKTGP